MLSSVASGLRPTDSFIVSTLQKHLLREVKLNDTAVKNPELLKWAPASRRYAITVTKSGGGDDANEDEEDALPDENAGPHEKSKAPRVLTKENPVTVAVYGQICMAAKSYQSAICQLHAFSLGSTALTRLSSLFTPCVRLLSRRSCYMFELSYCFNRSSNATTG